MEHCKKGTQHRQEMWAHWPFPEIQDIPLWQDKHTLLMMWEVNEIPTVIIQPLSEEGTSMVHCIWYYSYDHKMFLICSFGQWIQTNHIIPMGVLHIEMTIQANFIGKDMINDKKELVIGNFLPPDWTAAAVNTRSVYIWLFACRLAVFTNGLLIWLGQWWLMQALRLVKELVPYQVAILTFWLK